MSIRSSNPIDSSLPAAYIPGSYESAIAKMWEESGYANPDTVPKRTSHGKRRKKRAFSMVMPPPNITGKLHLGHASALAYEDLIVRYKRLRGFSTVYIPGTDHAAIATQNVVEKIIAKENLTRFQLGREKFLERVHTYVAETQGTIKQQIRSMGVSCDWSREAYTFDAVSTRVVNEVFIRMYNDGLVYQGNRIVNWCVRCGSTLADDEVQYIERKTPFYYFKYGPIVIGTARPETKFQDRVIVVHPDDKRYQHLIGTEFNLPWIHGTVHAKVIADTVIDPTLGTGAMTITPAHSFEDFLLAKKYDLEIVPIIDTAGRMTEAAGDMKGLTVKEAREKVVALLQEKGLVDDIDEDYVHNISVCYRCGTPVEPLVSKQWFVDVNRKIKSRNRSLKQLAQDVVRRREIVIVPDRFRSVYFQWLDNLHDWCISRQIWWGHRIPVWYCENDHPFAAVEKPIVSCNECGKAYVRQDEDTLDTWFSSATWSFSTLLDRDFNKYKDFSNWLFHSPDVMKYHPTSVLETGYDILFFWIARMVLVTTYIMREKPFDTVYLHGLVLDKQGQKMSKSKGNGIDPNEMITKYGADALRLSLVIGSAAGQDVRLYDEKIAGYRNFVNKLWNISRFILTTVDDIPAVQRKPGARTGVDAWILNRLTLVQSRITSHIEKWQFSMAGEALYDFTWHDLADWYIEIAKIQTAESPEAKKHTDVILSYVLERLLVLWHPFAPFVTEVLWQELHKQELLMIASWPRRLPPLRKSAKIKAFETMQEIVTRLRNIRAEQGMSSATRLPVSIQTKLPLASYTKIIERLGRCTIQDSVVDGDTIVGVGYILTVGVKAKKNEKKTAEIQQYIENLEAKLNNKDFTSHAPANVITEVKRKLDEAREKLGE